MKLLVVTQAMDADNPVLGFFVRWVEELAKQFDRVEVICLTEGAHVLPAQVRVYSLGKPFSANATKGMGVRLKYTLRFFRLVWKLRHNYDAVFVHMNQEYILLAGWFWKIRDVRVYFWRNHALGDVGTRLAVFFSHKVFYTSSRSFTARFKKALKMPVGIDTDFFKPSPHILRKPNTILFLGRIAPVKRVTEFVEALSELRRCGVAFSATIAGPTASRDAAYGALVHTALVASGLSDCVRCLGPVTPEQARMLYREHALYVNLTPPGSMDKTILEAMACGATPLVYTSDLESVVGPNGILTELTASEIARKIQYLFSHKGESSFRDFVNEHHSIQKLGALLAHEVCESAT